MKHKSLIFDADNTLYKTDPKKAYEKQFSFLCKSLCLNRDALEREWKNILKTVVLSNSLVERSRQFSLAKAVNAALNGKRTCANERSIEKAVKESIELFYEEVLRSGMDFSKKTPSMILRLKKKYNVFVASDEYRAFLEKKLSFVFGNMKDYFDGIVSCEDAGCLKPSKKFHEILIEKYNLAPKNCTIIGDSWERDLKTAKQAGITTVLVGTGEEGSPDFWIKEIGQLEGIL